MGHTFDETGNVARIESVNSIADADGDQIPDGWEADHGLNPNNPADALLDTDGDGLSNLAEFQAGTDPTLADTDGDGVPDGAEIAAGNTGIPGIRGIRGEYGNTGTPYGNTGTPTGIRGRHTY
jgi:hypothetical protein